MATNGNKNSKVKRAVAGILAALVFACAATSPVTGWAPARPRTEQQIGG